MQNRFARGWSCITLYSSLLPYLGLCSIYSDNDIPITVGGVDDFI